MPSSLTTFVAELKRRRVYHVAVVYVVVGVGVLSAAEVILDPLGLGGARALIVVLTLLGFPLALVLAWAFEVKRDEPAPAEGESQGEAAEPAQDHSSIVVLPFANLSSDSENEYFADGMTEEIINAFANISGLRVIARTSAFAFKGSSADIRDIGKQLGVGTVLEGSVRRSGDRLRITAQLIDVSGGHHLWSERYDRELEDVFAIQDEIAQIIAARLRPHDTVAPRDERPTESLEAYEAFLRGRFHFARGTPSDFAKSIEHYERATTLDPDFAEAYAAFAETWNEWAHIAEPKDRFPRAKATALKALELDATLADAYATLGNVHFLFDWDWNGAIESFERAIELNPNSARAHQHYVTLLGNLGRIEEAIEHGLRSVSLDPLSPYANHSAAFAHFRAGRFDESIKYDERALELAPDYLIAGIGKGMVLLESERLGEAEAHCLSLLTTWPDAPFVRACLAQIYDRMGKRNLALEQVRAIETHPGPNRGHVAHDAAWVHAVLGNVDEAFHWIDRALDARDPFMVGLATFYAWDPIRPDPRFEDVLRRMDFPDWSYKRDPGRP